MINFVANAHNSQKYYIRLDLQVKLGSEPPTQLLRPQILKHALDDSEPIADLQRKQVASAILAGLTNTSLVRAGNHLFAWSVVVSPDVEVDGAAEVGEVCACLPWSALTAKASRTRYTTAPPVIAPAAEDVLSLSQEGGWERGCRVASVWLRGWESAPNWPAPAHIYNQPSRACGVDALALWARVGPRISVGRELASHRGEPGSTLDVVAPRIFERGIRAGRFRWPAGFLGDLPFSPCPCIHAPLHLHQASPSLALKTPIRFRFPVESLQKNIFRRENIADVAACIWDFSWELPSPSVLAFELTSLHRLSLSRKPCSSRYIESVYRGDNEYHRKSFHELPTLRRWITCCAAVGRDADSNPLRLNVSSTARSLETGMISVAGLGFEPGASLTQGQRFATVLPCSVTLGQSNGFTRSDFAVDLESAHLVVNGLYPRVGITDQCEAADRLVERARCGARGDLQFDPGSSVDLIPAWPLPAPHIWAAVAEWLACSPPTKAIRVQSPAGTIRIFACGNRTGRCRWSAGLLGDLLFPPPPNSDAAPYSPQSPSSALKTSMLRAVQNSSLTHLQQRLACSPPTKANLVQPQPGHYRIFALRVFSGIYRFPSTLIPELLHSHFDHPHRLSRPRQPDMNEQQCDYLWRGGGEGWRGPNLLLPCKDNDLPLKVKGHLGQGHLDTIWLTRWPLEDRNDKACTSSTHYYIILLTSPTAVVLTRRHASKVLSLNPLQGGRVQSAPRITSSGGRGDVVVRLTRHRGPLRRWSAGFPRGYPISPCSFLPKQRREYASSRTCVYSKLRTTKANGTRPPCGNRLYIQTLLCIANTAYLIVNPLGRSVGSRNSLTQDAPSKPSRPAVCAAAVSRRGTAGPLILTDGGALLLSRPGSERADVQPRRTGLRANTKTTRLFLSDPPVLIVDTKGNAKNALHQHEHMHHNPPLHGHQDALVNPWKIPDCFPTRLNMVMEDAHIVH
ncbi:hypothetical protein PR048_033462 [Dryococelus australis]|uniref:Uncharacterized protein n=1 Tax=Dryococelus australis TaxID=614101 RepID=A0ABQ9G0C4_9NEOP|nr:hypothetical protein PR048_033462 [Dryococelus australis]